MNKVIWLIITTFYFVSVPAQELISADTIIDVDSLFNSWNASLVDSDSLDSNVVVTDSVENVEKKILSKKQPNSYFLPIKKIKISREDSLRFAREAANECLQNPMFVNWVFCSEMDREKSGEDIESIIEELRTEAKQYIAATEPELFDTHIDNLPDVGELKLRTRESRGFLDDFLLKQEIKKLPQTGVKIVRADKKWIINGKCSAQISQNYISPNWYTGGYSNLAILGYIQLKANYDDKKIFRFENTLEWKAGFNSTTSDTLRFLNTNEDIFRIATNFGLRAIKNWYYSLSGEFNTQLFNTFVENSRELTSSTFSPIRFYLSLGMEYKYKNIVKLNISPFSYKLTYVMNRSKAKGVEQSIADKFGIPSNKSTLNNIGSRVQVDVAYAFSKELKLESKMYVYTDYKAVEFDWEITGNFIANRFLTIQLSLHPRYDSSLVLVKGQKSKFQFREFVSLGFLYAF